MNLRALFLLTTIITATACAPSPGQEIAAGNSAFAEADYTNAADSYQAAVELDPVQAEPLYNLANTRYRQGIYTDTHQLLPQVASLGSEEIAAQSHFNKGNAHYQLEDWETAIDSYKESLRINPNDVEAKYNLELAMRNIAQQQEQDQQQENQENQENQEQDQQDQQEQQDQEQDRNEQQQDGQEEQQEQQDSQDSQSGEEQQEEESPQEDQQQSAENSEPQEEESQEAQQAQSAEPQEGLTAEQARQLLRAVGQNTETLQEQMQLVLPNEGPPPEKDW